MESFLIRKKVIVAQALRLRRKDWSGRSADTGGGYQRYATYTVEADHESEVTALAGVTRTVRCASAAPTRLTLRMRTVLEMAWAVWEGM